jgi:acetate kinase
MVLTVNAGSSSLHLVLVEGEAVPDRLDLTGPPDSPSTDAAVAAFVKEHPAPDAVGHRLVHGGDVVLRPTVVDDALLAAVRGVTDLAPLHLPPALHLVEVLREWLPDVPHVLCPDTGFHADLPEHAATYPLPAAWRDRSRVGREGGREAYSLRRYGFHGLSYAWATRRAAQLLGRPVVDLRMVLAHLGGGASVCAVWGGRSVDTSMGFTPLDGVPMSTRSGAVDPGMLLWLLEPGRLSLDELRDGLHHHSGLLGLSGGRSGDTRELVAAAAAEDAQAALALAVYAHRVRREIAAAATNLDRLDALVFTGEIGWDQPEVRHAVCTGLRVLGVPLPARGNLPEDGLISPDGAAVPVLVVQPREELQLAEDVRQVV